MTSLFDTNRQYVKKGGMKNWFTLHGTSLVEREEGLRSAKSERGGEIERKEREKSENETQESANFK